MSFSVNQIHYDFPPSLPFPWAQIPSEGEGMAVGGGEANEGKETVHTGSVKQKGGPIVNHPRR